MSQVIIVSNRLPVSVKKEDGELSFYPSVGGLATGLSSYVNDKRSVWIGWPGIASDDLGDLDRQIIVAELAKHNCSPVWLSQKEIDDFYNGYSNTVLWPLFHNLKRQDKDDEARRRQWQAYNRVNQKFAEATLNVAESDGHIWVHDYQLLLVPKYLHAERQDIKTGFFLHIPFPESSVFAGLTQHKKLLQGMLGADIVGFHTAGYVTNFLQACLTAGLGEVSGDRILYEGRVVRAGDYPMGIDYFKYSSAGRSSAVKTAARKYRQRYKGRKVIVAVDRLDPSKGLVERLKAYRMFLERNPRLHGKVVFAMVAAPSRTDVPAYRNLAKRLSALVKAINADFGTAKWQPIDYINETLPFEEVTALFHVADVAFIAPLRDGMNLAAKEFVASTHKNGALILSETAGASEELSDALLVNPQQPESLVEALSQALTMRRRELRRRLRRMQQRLSTHTVQDWAQEFVTALQKPVPGTPVLTRTLRDKLERQLLFAYNVAPKRLLLLDYDGSLVPFAENYQDTKPPKRLLDLISKLAAVPGNDVVLISGRSSHDLEKWFGGLPINLVAEHGAAIRRVGRPWQVIEKPNTAWKMLLKPVLNKYARLTPKARVETKPHSLVWHYRGAPPYYAQKYAVILKRSLKPVLKKYGLELLQGNKVLEIKNPAISKGRAAERWLRRNYDFVLALGDDATDEELFNVLPLSAYSLKVGRGRTAARFRVASHIEVLKLLRKLAK